MNLLSANALWRALVLLHLVLLGLPGAGIAEAFAQDASRITYPVNGSSDARSSAFVQWQSIPNATAYYLYVGTAIGLKDLVDTGEIQTTQWPMIALPAGRLLFARLYTKKPTGWSWTDTTFELQPMASFLSPASEGQELDVRGDRISWTAVDGAQAYYLYVGREPASKELINSGELHKNSVSIASLPVGALLHARLWTKHAGMWRYVDRSFRTRPVAYFMSPSNSSAELDVRKDAIAWTAVPRAEAYYLYVGTEPGAKNLVDTGEINRTTEPIRSLQAGTQVFARIWTKHGGIWRFVDSSFVTRPTAYFVNPQELPVEFDVRLQRISWTEVAGAQSYYLYVGTSVGAKDLLNTGEISKTSVSAVSLPVGRTLYARLWTKHRGVWRYLDRSFKTRPVAYIDNISNGQWNIDVRQRISWTSVQSATAYYLYVGTSRGANDLINSGEISTNSYSLLSLPGNLTAYVTLWTKHEGQWRNTELTFATSRSARLIDPSTAVADIGTAEQQFAWNTVNGALGYRVWIGQDPGDGSLFDSGLMAETMVRVPALPGGEQINVRIGTLTGSGWTYEDIRIATRSIPALQQPRLGSIAVNAPLTVKWTAVSSANAYRLELGDGVGRNNLFDSGETSALEHNVGWLPADQAVYARVSALVNGVWRYTDSVFTTQAVLSAATMLSPAGGTELVPGYGFEWTPVAVARSYRLEIGTTPGATDVAAISDLNTTRRIVAGLPTGITLYGRLITESFDGSEQVSSFSFVTGGEEVGADDVWGIARWAVGFVRGMATPANEPDPTSPLASWIDRQGRQRANCMDYASVLRMLFDQLGVSVSSRMLDVCLVPNTYDCHTSVEVRHPSDGTWTPLDPTFGLSVRRTASGGWATASDLSNSTRSLGWGAIEYEFLTPPADAYARQYYLDFPLLFTNVYLQDGTGFLQEPPGSVSQYYEHVGASVAGAAGFYALQCPVGAAAVSATIDGSDEQLPCSTSDRLTHVFSGSSIHAVNGASDVLRIYRPRRFVF